MTTTRSRLRRLVPVLGLTLTLAVSAACTPDQLRNYFDRVGYDHSGWTDEQYEAGAAWAAEFWKGFFASLGQDKFASAVSDDGLARLRACESGGDYGAVGGGGAYRGAYQFAQSTWNAVAARHYPSFAGVDPASAPAEVQDKMARALFAEQGRRPWPVCGQRV